VALAVHMNCLLFALLYARRFGGRAHLRRRPHLATAKHWAEPFGHWVIRTARYDIMFASLVPVPWWRQLSYPGKVLRRRYR